MLSMSGCPTAASAERASSTRTPYGAHDGGGEPSRPAAAVGDRRAAAGPACGGSIGPQHERVGRRPRLRTSDEATYTDARAQRPQHFGQRRSGR